MKKIKFFDGKKYEEIPRGYISDNGICVNIDTRKIDRIIILDCDSGKMYRQI